MSKNKPKTVLYRRKRELKTNYGKRLSLLLAKKARLVVRFTNQRIIAQLVSFDGQGDKVVLGVNSMALKKLGWNYSCKNYPAAYLTGLLMGKTALGKGFKEGILDTGLTSPLKGSKLYAFLKGVLDAGLSIPYSEEIFPDEETLKGGKVKAYAESLKVNKEAYDRQFAEYLKNNQQPEDIEKIFEEVKKKIVGKE